MGSIELSDFTMRYPRYPINAARNAQTLCQATPSRFGRPGSDNRHARIGVRGKHSSEGAEAKVHPLQFQQPADEEQANRIGSGWRKRVDGHDGRRRGRRQQVRCNGQANARFVTELPWNDLHCLARSYVDARSFCKRASHERIKLDQPVRDVTKSVSKPCPQAIAAAQTVRRAFAAGDWTENEGDSQVAHETRQANTDPRDMMNAVEILALVNLSRQAVGTKLPEVVIKMQSLHDPIEKGSGPVVVEVDKVQIGYA